MRITVTATPLGSEKGERISDGAVRSQPFFRGLIYDIIAFLFDVTITLKKCVFTETFTNSNLLPFETCCADFEDRLLLPPDIHPPSRGNILTRQRFLENSKLIYKPTWCYSKKAYYEHAIFIFKKPLGNSSSSGLTKYVSVLF